MQDQVWLEHLCAFCSVSHGGDKSMANALTYYVSLPVSGLR